LQVNWIVSATCALYGFQGQDNIKNALVAMNI